MIIDTRNLEQLKNNLGKYDLAFFLAEDVNMSLYNK